MLIENIPKIYRHEVKFFINRQDAFLLQRMLSKSMYADLNADNNGEYFIRSLYFDSLDNRDYLEKINGFSQRKKIRIRIYNTNEMTAKLELKNKYGNYIRKESILIDRSDVCNLMSGNNEALIKYQDVVANKIYAYMHLELLRPIILIDYERHAFTYNFDNIRITLDKDVRASICPWKLYEKNISMVPVISDGRYILEVKFQTILPSFIKTMLSTVNPELTSISKYCLARQAVSI